VYNFQSFYLLPLPFTEPLAVPFDLEAKSLLKFTVVKHLICFQKPTSNDLPVEIPNELPDFF
jgi:hypothetical protein